MKIYLAIKDQQNFTKKDVDVIAEEIHRLMVRYSLNKFHFDADENQKKIIITPEMSQVTEASALMQDVLHLIERYHLYGASARWVEPKELRAYVEQKKNQKPTIE